MEKRELFIGDILQLKPDYPNFGGMLVVCTEPKEFGCQGYLLSSRNFKATRFKNRAFVRPKFENMEYVGHLRWQ